MSKHCALPHATKMKGDIRKTLNFLIVKRQPCSASDRWVKDVVSAVVHRARMKTTVEDVKGASH